MNEPTANVPLELPDSERPRPCPRDCPLSQRSLWQSTLGIPWRNRIRVLPRYLSQLNKYERLREFSDRLPSDAARETAADRVLASFEAVTLTNGTDPGPQHELHRDMLEFHKAVVTTPYWYTYGDLFEFSDLHLEDLFYPRGYGETFHEPVRDSEHFVKHLQGVLRPNCHAFVHKIAVFVKSLCKTGHDLEAFLLLAYALTNLHYVNININIKTGLKRQMQMLLERHLRKNFETPAWCCIPTYEVSRFLDKPAAYRRFYAEMKDMRTPPPHMTRRLKVLEKQAWRRIRLNVCLACGSRLPPELVETIFEHSLRREGVPLSLCSVRDAEGISSSRNP